MDIGPDIAPAEGSAFPWILEHLLAYPGTYEIPLRTMYTNNVLAQTNRPSTPGSSSNNSPNNPFPPPFPGSNGHNRQSTATQAATQHFKSSLMEQIAFLPSQPFSLPPSFITSFVRRCFTEDLCLVDFTQALTALDYLKDLETRRKRELSAALRRLDINVDAIDVNRDELAKRSSAVAEWMSSMEDKERRVEALYTQVYIGLRRWTLINEMRLAPFSKPNCIAMLNTLYPPTPTFPPTPQLTPTILSSQRNAFFRYIQAVERAGKGVLVNLEQQSRRPHEPNGWPVVRDIVDKYLRTANAVIDDCVAVASAADLDLPAGKPGRRADSGVSFASSDRPSTSTGHTSGSGGGGGLNTDKPLPASPRLQQACPPTPSKTRGSTLERIAREIRRIKTRSAENRSKQNPDNHSPPTATAAAAGNKGGALHKKRSLKKMKSASSALGRAASETRGYHSRGGSGERTGLGLCEIDDAKREQLIRDAVASRGKENSPPVAVERPLMPGQLGSFGPGRAELM
ncbi:hypothetical protein MMC26_002199 [Xylographa opegraphella]|nr:hypothetical protein [Xylographa opegraphella]